MPAQTLSAAWPATVRARWWLPSMAEIVFVSVFLWVLLGGQARALLADGDTGWHIRTGDYILSERRFPTTDLYSFSLPGAPWFAWEWGSDVLFSLAHRAAGLKGVAVFSGGLIALTSALLFQYMLWRQANVILAVVVMLAAASASSVHWLARPHLFTCLLVLVCLWLLEADRQRPGQRVWMLVPLAALWANLHGGFVVLIGMLAIYALAALIETVMAGGAKNWWAPLRYLSLALAAAAATLLNPYGHRLHLHILRYLNSDFIRDHVQEFQSPLFRSESMQVFELLLAAGLVAVPALWRRREYAQAMLVLALAHAALASVRHVLLYVTVAAPVAAGELSRLLESRIPGSRKSGWAGILAEMAADYASGPGAAQRPGWLPLWGCASIVVAALLLNSGPARWQVEFPREKFPLAAVVRTEKMIVGHRVFTSDQWGDYLIYRFYPNVRVFVDGRSDFYGSSVGQQYLEAQQAHYRWPELWKRYGFEVALVAPEWPLATLLKADPGWRLEYDDGQAVVLSRIGALDRAEPRRSDPH